MKIVFFVNMHQVIIIILTTNLPELGKICPVLYDVTWKFVQGRNVDIFQFFLRNMITWHVKQQVYFLSVASPLKPRWWIKRNDGEWSRLSYKVLERSRPVIVFGVYRKHKITWYDKPCVAQEFAHFVTLFVCSFVSGIKIAYFLSQRRNVSKKWFDKTMEPKRCIVHFWE